MSGEITQLLRAVSSGDNNAVASLFQIVYEELRARARAQLAGSLPQTLGATALVHEAYLKLTAGDAPEWKRPPGRIDVPAVEDAAPAPGKRVRYRLPGDEKSGIYSVLNLPEDWQSGKKYPVIVEYPGNIMFAPVCYSTGLPDQCVIGYGITRGKGAICLGMPFLDRATNMIAENAWGNADDTTDYLMRIVAEVCDTFGQ